MNEIDAVAGKRKRSEFIEEAVRERLLWVKQGMALDNLIASGGLNLDEYPYWATPEKVTEWVRGQRQLDNDWLKELLKRQDELADAGKWCFIFSMRTPSLMYWLSSRQR